MSEVTLIVKDIERVARGPEHGGGVVGPQEAVLFVYYLFVCCCCVYYVVLRSVFIMIVFMFMFRAAGSRPSYGDLIIISPIINHFHLTKTLIVLKHEYIARGVKFKELLNSSL